jgi:hypothetical protein
MEICKKCNNILVDEMQNCTLCGEDRNSSYDDYYDYNDDYIDYEDHDDNGEQFVFEM